ncbi:MAG TPA: hypothetical protein VI997_07430 [Candidatus Thermoplasmatota archaeon]|nr:hypothetical protein [Candidatus Thermoplasmatota archaeon]
MASLVVACLVGASGAFSAPASAEGPLKLFFHSDTPAGNARVHPNAAGAEYTVDRIREDPGDLGLAAGLLLLTAISQFPTPSMDPTPGMQAVPATYHDVGSVDVRSLLWVLSPAWVWSPPDPFVVPGSTWHLSFWAQMGPRDPRAGDPTHQQLWIVWEAYAESGSDGDSFWVDVPVQPGLARYDVEFPARAVSGDQLLILFETVAHDLNEGMFILYDSPDFPSGLELPARVGPPCSDGFDNDGDGLIDAEDPPCNSWTGTEIAVCQDGIDNDGDGRTDYTADPDCNGDPNAPDEVPPPL